MSSLVLLDDGEEPEPDWWMGVILKGEVVNFNRLVHPQGMPGPVSIRVEMVFEKLSTEAFNAFKNARSAPARLRMYCIVLPDNEEP